MPKTEKMDCFKETQMNINRTLDLISCVKCSSHSKEMFIIFTCDHKYCENCIPKDSRKMEQEKCPLCNSDTKQDEVRPDAYTTKLLESLLGIQALLNEKAASNTEMIPPVFDVEDVDVEVVMNNQVGNINVQEDDENLGIGNIIENEDNDIIGEKSEDVVQINPPPKHSDDKTESIVKDHIGNTASSHSAIEIQNLEGDNDYEDFFQDAYESDDMIVATQIRPRRSTEVNPKQIFPKDNPAVAAVGNEKLSIPIVDLDFDSECQEVKKTQPLPRKKRLPSVRRLNASLTNVLKKDAVQDNKKQEHAAQLSDSLPLETPKGATIEDKSVKGKDDQRNKDGKTTVQTQFRKSLTAVKPKKIFFTSKRKNSDDDSDSNSNPITDIGMGKVVKEGSIEDNDFLSEILNPPPKIRVPFKPLKTYTKSSKPKIKPRLNYAHASDSEEDFFNTPKQSASKKLEKPPDLTPYTNKSYSPVRKRMKVKKMGETENLSTCEEKESKRGDRDSTGKKVFDYNDRSPSPPPLTPYPVQPADDKKESNLRSRKRQCTSSVDLTSSKKSSESVKIVPDKPAKKSGLKSGGPSSKTSLATIKKEKLLSTPTQKGGRRASSAVTLCDSPGSSSISSSASFCFTPGGVNKRNSKGETLLHVAARKGDIKKVEELIAAKLDLDAVDYNGYTALHEAISSRSKLSNNFAIAKLLCDAGCNVNVPAGDYKETPLHEASRLGFRSVVELLLSNKASPNIRNAQGILARDLTTSESVKKLIDAAVKSKEDVNLSAEEMDDPAVLKIQFETVTAFFAYDVPQQIVKECQNDLKIKFTKELRNDVTHIVFKTLPQSHVSFGFEYLYGLMNGSWMVSSKWIEDSLKQGTFISPRKYEILGCQPSTLPMSDCNLLSNDEAPKRSRVNKELGNPGLFHGMNFLLYKNTAFSKLTKKDLGKLISTGNGQVINREPNPDAVDPMENPERFHAREANNKLVLTSHVILFDQTNQPAKKLNMEHVKSLSIKWLIDSSLNFKLLDPENYIN